MKLLLLLYFSLGSFNVFADTITIHTPLGQIKGSSKNFTTRYGKKVFAFRGIRYAEPPIGDLRFAAPILVKPWHQVLNAVEEGPACPQPIPDVAYNVSEDCLRLNIYTRQFSSKRPVMVYFHPGGFYSVSGISKFTGPDYLLDHDVVLVTVNYRLGSLGFLSYGDDVLPGNFGMKDQVMALRFIKQNIAAYGGNPENVTIMGYSAGAISVTLHLVSPMTQGLFHKAISMSGSPTGTYPFPTHQRSIAIKQAALLNCPTESSLEIVKCLRTKKAQDIANTFFAFQEVGSDPILIWSPVIETETKSERYLVRDPIKEIKNGNYMKVPFMTGVTKYEFANLAYRVVINKTLENIWNRNFDRVAPIAFIYERNSTRSKDVSEKLRKFYFSDKKISMSTVDKLGQAYADGLIGFSVNRLVNLISETNSFETFYYRFSFKGVSSHFYLPNTTEPIGPVHHDDLIYLFDIPIGFPFIGIDNPEASIVECETTMWSNFAISGNPNYPGKCESMKNKIWKPYTNKQRHYFDIDRELNLKSNLYADRYNLWDQLFPLPV